MEVRSRLNIPPLMKKVYRWPIGGAYIGKVPKFSL